MLVYISKRGVFLFNFLKNLNINIHLKFIETLNISFKYLFKKTIYILPNTKKVDYSISYKILHIIIKLIIICIYSITNYFLFKYVSNNTIENFSLYNLNYHLNIDIYKIFIYLSFFALLISWLLFIKIIFSNKNRLYFPIFIFFCLLFIVSKYPLLILQYNY